MSIVKRTTGRSLVSIVAAAVVALVVVGLFPAAAFATPPSNDNFANAEVLTERIGWRDADNSEATKEPGEPNHAGNPGGASIWYSVDGAVQRSSQR